MKEKRKKRLINSKTFSYMNDKRLKGCIGALLNKCFKSLKFF